MKRKRETEVKDMEIVWQTPANLPVRNDYIFRNGNFILTRFQILFCFVLFIFWKKHLYLFAEETEVQKDKI